MNNICQVGLQQLGKAKLYSEYGSMDIFYNLSHFVPTFFPTQGYLLKFMALTHHRCTTSRMIPPRFHTNSSLYMLLILQFKLLLCIISPQHQSFIQRNTSNNTTHAMIQLWRNRNQTTTTHFYKLLILYDLPQMQSKNHKLVFLRFRIPLLILVQQPLIFVSLVCLKHPWAPIIYCQLVSHNTQTTKFRTHNH